MEEDEAPPLDAIPMDGELPAYWAENTTITVSRYTKARLDEHRDGKPWDTFLEGLRQEHDDPLTFNDAEQIAEYLSDEVDIDIDAEDVIDVNGGPDVDLKSLKRSIETVEERTGKIERQLESITQR